MWILEDNGGQFPPYEELAIRGTRATELPCRILVYVSYIFLPVTIKGWWAVPTLQEVFVRYSSVTELDCCGMLSSLFSPLSIRFGSAKNIPSSNHGVALQESYGEVPPLMAGRK